jgi:hypothetical protein
MSAPVTVGRAILPADPLSSGVQPLGKAAAATIGRPARKSYHRLFLTHYSGYFDPLPEFR